jgi:hypothetical protein
MSDGYPASEQDVRKGRASKRTDDELRKRTLV